MKFRKNIPPIRGIEPINLVAFINVVFLLLIFVLLSSSFTSQPAINIKLPKAVTSGLIQEKNLIITITNEDIIYFNNQVSTIKELHTELAKPANQNCSILIKADRRSSVGRIVDIWDLCRKLGIERVNIAANQEP